jgi:hypothetical protein
MTKRKAKQNDGTSIRLPDDLKRGVLSAARTHAKFAEEYGSFSAYAKLAMAEDVRLWKHSPSIALSARHFLYVDASGNFIYRCSERLEANKDMSTIHASIGMKHAKIAAYLDQCTNEQPTDTVKFLRDRWRDVSFSLRSEHGLRVVTHDAIGITSKSAVIPYELPAKHVVTRETCATLVDYVQWYDGAERTDSVEIDVDIPTLDFELWVLIDADIYDATRNSRRPPLAQGSLHFELQTADGQRLADVSKELITKISNVLPATGTQAEDFRKEVINLQQAWATARRSFKEAGGEIPDFPERAFFYCVRAKRQNPGLRYAVTWPRPERPVPPGVAPAAAG